MPIDPKVFRKNLTYSNTALTAEILTDLTQILEIDQSAEKEQKKYRNLLIGSIVVAVLGIVLLATVVATAIGLVLLVVGAIAAIVAGILMAYKGRLNIANYRHQFARKVLEMLARDMEPDAEVNLQLVFSQPDEKTKLIHQGDHPYRSGWKIKLFADKCLTAQGKFFDGTRFCLSATEMYQTQSGWKRGRSGKMKHKTKSKSKGWKIKLDLKCSQHRYGAVQLLKEEANGAVKLPEYVQLKTLEITDKAIELKVKTPPWAEAVAAESLYQTVTMMFLSLYQVLNLARLLSKKKAV